MPAINFSERFAGAVASGKKCQTIRRIRKRPIRIGDWLLLYSGMRTKYCRKLGEASCRLVEPILITKNTVRIGKRELGSLEIMMLALTDGFETIQDFFAWFDDHYGLPFEGVLIRWQLRFRVQGGEGMKIIGKHPACPTCSLGGVCATDPSICKRLKGLNHGKKIKNQRKDVRT